MQDPQLVFGLGAVSIPEFNSMKFGDIKAFMTDKVLTQTLTVTVLYLNTISVVRTKGDFS